MSPRHCSDPTGAAAVFGPQKGANPGQVGQLDDALRQFASLLGGDPGAPGAGAAGGTAYGFATVYGAEIVPGADHLAQLTGLDARARRARMSCSPARAGSTASRSAARSSGSC